MSESNPEARSTSKSTIAADLQSGVVVFLVALPLCLGIAIASGVPPFAGLVAGIVGGLIVGALSGSHTSVSGPAAGLTAIVLQQLEVLSFEQFLLATVLAGVFQIAMGAAKAGALSAYFPTSVIKGLLAAIGVLLILKQVPHLVGHDQNPEGDLAYFQPDGETTLSEIWSIFSSKEPELVEPGSSDSAVTGSGSSENTGEDSEADEENPSSPRSGLVPSTEQDAYHIGASIVGLLCLAILLAWDKLTVFKLLKVPGPLFVVVLAVLLNMLFDSAAGKLGIQGEHLVQVPQANSTAEFIGFLKLPDFSSFFNVRVILAGMTIAIVASLETLLNLQAVDKLDQQQRTSPANRELFAQGVGNICSGFVGGLPVTSVVVRGSVNVASGSRTKLSTLIHGSLLLVCVAFVPQMLNMIPKASLAAILIATGLKLARPALFRQMWQEGRYQFAPFIVTLLAIVYTDLLTGICVGLGVALLFILNSNMRRPIRRIVKTRTSEDLQVIELASQVSFLNKAAMTQMLDEIPAGTRVLIDGSDTNYLDPDLIALIRDFRDHKAPAKGILFSLRGFHNKFELPNSGDYEQHSQQEHPDKLNPAEVFALVKEGNRRFVNGDCLRRDFTQQIAATAAQENPFAAVLSCIDSRVPTEIVFDAGLGDIFSVRVAGNVPGTQELASLEYAVTAAGVRLIVVLGHTRCGAIETALRQLAGDASGGQESGQCFLSIVDEIRDSVSVEELESFRAMDSVAQRNFADEVSRRNVNRTVEWVRSSSVIQDGVGDHRLFVTGAVYHIPTGEIEFLSSPPDIPGAAVSP